MTTPQPSWFVKNSDFINGNINNIDVPIEMDVLNPNSLEMVTYFFGRMFNEELLMQELEKPWNSHILWNEKSEFNG